jgi:hypothetical protein
MTGDQILRKSAEGYAALTSYVGTTTVQRPTSSGGSAGEPGATVTLTFVRPAKIHMIGSIAARRGVALISDGRETWLAETTRNNGTYERAPDVETAITTLAAPATIPAVLMNLNTGNPFRGVQGSRLEGRETTRGFDCYKIVGSVGASKRTFWVDSGKFLLRQMKEEPGDAQAGNRGSGSAPAPVLYSFITLQIDEPVNEQRFQAPARPLSLLDIPSGAGRILEK